MPKRTKDRLGWKHTRHRDNSQGAAEAAQTHEETPGHAAQEVPRGTRQGRRLHQPFHRRWNSLHEYLFQG